MTMPKDGNRSHDPLEQVNKKEDIEFLWLWMNKYATLKKHFKTQKQNKKWLLKKHKSIFYPQVK
jgi:hypothetical protein